MSARALCWPQVAQVAASVRAAISWSSRDLTPRRRSFYVCQLREALEVARVRRPRRRLATERLCGSCCGDGGRGRVSGPACGRVESLGQRTPEAVAGLRLMGADAYAALLEQVAWLFPTGGAADADTRLSAMDAWGDREVSQLDQFTRQFLELQQAHDLEERFVAPFVRAHPRQFPLRVEDL